MNAVGSIKIKAPLIVDQVCRGTKQFKLTGLFWGFYTCANWPTKPVDSWQEKLNHCDTTCDWTWWIFDAMCCGDNKAGERRYLLWINNLNSLKCIRTVHMTAILPARTGTIKKLSALTKWPGIDKKSYWWTELNGDQATDQCQSLESKKTFRLQIKKEKTKKQYHNKKNNFEKAAEYKT